MQIILHKADERGYVNHGWLRSHHSFSFASYYDPSKVHFGMLRVLNDDFISGGQGFGTHPHDNMEIITIPLKGALQHKDSMGSGGIITEGELQIMSAGSGITHSEFNASQADPVELLQVWIFPKMNNIEPRYEQKKFDSLYGENAFYTAVGPLEGDAPLRICQDAYFSFASVEAGTKLEYAIKHENNGCYLFVIDGNIQVQGTELFSRDAVGISKTEHFEIEALENSLLLAIDVPMN